MDYQNQLFNGKTDEKDSIKFLLVAACLTKQYVIHSEKKSEILLPDNKVCSTQSNEFLSCGEV